MKYLSVRSRHPHQLTSRREPRAELGEDCANDFGHGIHILIIPFWVARVKCIIIRQRVKDQIH